MKLPSWLSWKLLDTIRRQQPCDMSALIAEAEIAERLDASTLTADELATALAGLEKRFLVRNLRPGLAPLWRLTPTGREALDQHRALHGDHSFTQSTASTASTEPTA